MMTFLCANTDLLWDVDPSGVDPVEHLGFLIGRVLGSGSVEDIGLLRVQVGDATLRNYLERTRGRRIDRKKLRYLGLILELDHSAVTGWISDPSRKVWEGR